MRSFRASTALATLAVATALALTACSDVMAPGADDSPALIIGPTAQNPGSTVVPFASNATTRLCGFEAFAVNNGVVPATTPINNIAGCSGAVDLQAALAAYNPGWDANYAGSSWIGNQATANQYLVPNGVYRYTTVVNLPAGATGIVLNDTLKTDNAVAVYVNGTKLEAQVIMDCPRFAATCNWQNVQQYIISDNNQAHFVTGANQITVLHYATPIGFGTNPAEGKNCSNGPQQFGRAGFAGPFNVPTPQYGQPYNETNCYNPAAVNFTGNVSYVPYVPPSTTWCSPGWWKNHGVNGWTQYHGKLYSTLPAGKAPLGKKAPAGYDPTLLEVVSTPNTYGGPAANSVADWLSFKAFGTPIGSGVESCPGGNIVVP